MKKSIIFNCVPPFDTHLPSPALSILKSWLAKHNISAPDVHMRKTADRVDEIIDDIFSRIDFSEFLCFGFSIKMDGCDIKKNW